MICELYLKKSVEEEEEGKEEGKKKEEITGTVAQRTDVGRCREGIWKCQAHHWEDTAII
jgi:ribosomal protein L37AE/L43A